MRPITYTWKPQTDRVLCIFGHSILQYSNDRHWKFLILPISTLLMSLEAFGTLCVLLDGKLSLSQFPSSYADNNAYNEGSTVLLPFDFGRCDITVAKTRAIPTSFPKLWDKIKVREPGYKGIGFYEDSPAKPLICVCLHNYSNYFETWGRYLFNNTFRSFKDLR